MKRVIDLIVALTVLILLLPILILVSMMVRTKMGSPIFFRQVRPGFKGRTFELIKFRTMLNAVNHSGNSLPDEQRLGSFGKFLRSTSLDELPALWNVLKGDLSLVGPRPLLVEYLPLYSEEQAKRHNVLPGITGWAQINGRNAISWNDKFKYDVWYVENKSFWLDLKILFITLKKVITKEGVSADNHVTMPFFTGSTNNMEDKDEK